MLLIRNAASLSATSFGCSTCTKWPHPTSSKCSTFAIRAVRAALLSRKIGPVSDPIARRVGWQSARVASSSSFHLLPAGRSLSNTVGTSARAVSPYPQFELPTVYLECLHPRLPINLITPPDLGVLLFRLADLAFNTSAHINTYDSFSDWPMDSNILPSSCEFFTSKVDTDGELVEASES